MSRPVLLLFALALPAPAADPPRADLVGDTLPTGAVARLGSDRFTLYGYKRVFLPGDGRTVVALGNNKLRAWDVDTGNVRWTWTDESAFRDPFGDLSSDGSRLAVGLRDLSGGSQIVRVYDVANRRPVWSVDVGGNSGSTVTDVRFTPDGKHVVSATEVGVHVWDAATGRVRARHPVPAWNIDVSADGKSLAIGGYQAVVWDWSAGAEPQGIDLPRPAELHFAPGGRSVLATGSGRWLRCFDRATGRPLAPLELDGRPGEIVPGPDGRTAAIHYTYTSPPEPRSATLVLWDLAAGKPGKVLATRRDRVYRSRWSADGGRIVAENDFRLFVWDARTGRRLGPDAPAHAHQIKAVAFAGGRVFTASADHTVRAWDVASGRQALVLEQDDSVEALAVSPDGTLVAGSAQEKDLRVWDARTGKEVFKLPGHGRPWSGARHVRFSADEQTLLAYGNDFYLRAFDVLTGKLKSEHRLKPPPAGGGPEDEDDNSRSWSNREPAALGADGATLYKGVGRDVIAYAADTGKERIRFEAGAGEDGVQHLAVSSDGRRLVVVGIGRRGLGFPVAVWDLAELTLVVRFTVPGSGGCSQVAVAPDGKQVVTMDDEATELRFWDTATGAAVGVLPLPMVADAIGFDGGNRVPVALRDTTVLVYDLTTAVKK